MTYKPARDLDLWNMACDYAINLLLVNNGIKLPKDALFDQRYKNMSADAIYDQLVTEVTNNTEGN